MVFALVKVDCCNGGINGGSQLFYRNVIASNGENSVDAA